MYPKEELKLKKKSATTARNVDDSEIAELQNSFGKGMKEWHSLKWFGNFL